MSDTDQPTKDNTVVIGEGAVEYDLAEAAVPIGTMIEALQDAEADGAEYVVALSGNNRGAKYAHVDAGRLETVEEAL